MYKCIVFDIGGVMVDFDPREYLVDCFCNAETEDLVYRLTFGSDEWKLIDAGVISRLEGNARMLANARREDREFEVQRVIDDWTRILRPRRRMIELVQKLKAHGYLVYYLSNISEDVYQTLIGNGPLAGLFDGGVASYEVHINKPDARIYEAFLERYSLKASECVFIDDSRANVQAAFALGFAGITMREGVGTLMRSLATCNIILQ